MYMGILLKRLGFTVLPAENGLEVLKLLKFCEPDVIILDVWLGGMDGTSILRYIKEDRLTSNIPVIMVSSDCTSSVIKKCKSLGCAGYLKKPIKVKKLHDILESCVFSQIRKKRKHLRVPINKKVTVVLEGTKHKLYTETLSERGIFIRKKDPFPLGSKVEVILPLDDKKPVKLKGEVIHVKGILEDVMNVPPGMGIEFKKISKSNLKILRNFIKKEIGEDIVESQEEDVIDLADE
jgi:two-component system cell cycle response regulator/two-component system cell cycle response regulator DivK